MNVSVDISYYPLKEQFKPAILDLIYRLQNYKQLEITGNGISTQIFGQYDEVMQILTKEMKNSFELPHSVFVLKIINTDLS